MKEMIQNISGIFKILSHPVRVQILQEIGKGEACVCHLESQLGIRQAALSQHLMALREAELLETRRDGRYIFYRLTHAEILDIIQKAGDLLGLEFNVHDTEHKACDCPKCCE